ncbi:MAG: hypothetical protein NTV49_05550 [Kiritimatiellaeota bacterium]|nr:hypothetical protein [Kiritimatiellota bacterium]
MRGPVKKIFGWQTVLALILISASVAVYALHYAIFHDLRNIFYYLLMDIAFSFISVLLVTLVLNRLLVAREKRAMIKKLDMVIGAFHSEVGHKLIRILSVFDPQAQEFGKRLLVTSQWSGGEFAQALHDMRDYDCQIDHRRGDLGAVKELLAEKKEFLLALLENPNLLEHESFTNLLWAVFHLAEELSFRTDLQGLPESDLTHLDGDMKRVYLLLIYEWILHIQHLKSDYPYLFSLASRTNPFDPSASPIVRP